MPEVCSDVLGGNPQLGAEGRGTPALNETRGSLAGGGGCGRSPHFERGRSCCRGSQTGSSGESKHSRARFPEKCSLPLCDVMASRRDAPRTTRAWVSQEARDPRPGPPPGVHIRGPPWGLAVGGGRRLLSSWLSLACRVAREVGELHADPGLFCCGHLLGPVTSGGLSLLILHVPFPCWPWRVLRESQRFLRVPCPGPRSLSGPMLRDAACFIWPLSGRVCRRRESRLGPGRPEAGGLCLASIHSLSEACPVVLGGLPRGFGRRCGFLPSRLGRRASLAKLSAFGTWSTQRVKRAVSLRGSPVILVCLFLVSPCVKEELVSPAIPCSLGSQRVLRAGVGSGDGVRVPAKAPGWFSVHQATRPGLLLCRKG